MESLLSPVPLLLFGLGLLFCIRVAREWSAGSKARGPFLPLPPGPWGLPIIGSIHHFAVGLPHCNLTALARRHGPLMLLRLGQVDLAVASNREAAEDVLRTHDLNFASRVKLTGSKLADRALFFSPYGDHWRHLRKVATVEFFTARRVRSFAAIRKEQALSMINSIKTAALSRTPVDISRELMLLSSSIVAASAVGRRCRQQERLAKIADEVVKLMSGFSVADLFPSLKVIDVLTGLSSKILSLRREIEEVIDEIISDKEMRNGNGGDRAHSTKDEEDILGVLLRLKDDRNQEFPITLSVVKDVIVELFVAGTETSATAAEWAMSELIRNPKAMEKAQREVREALKGKPNFEETDLGQLNYLKQVIKETFRLHPPAPLLLPRATKETCQIMGYKIPAGTRMMINIWAMGRDPQHWDEAEKFKPERFEDGSVDFKGMNFEYLPFGGGRRICVGMAFGVASVEIALAQLLFHFDWSLPGGMKPQDLDMTETFGASLRRRSQLCLLATPHFPATAD